MVWIVVCLRKCILFRNGRREGHESFHCGSGSDGGGGGGSSSSSSSSSSGGGGTFVL